MKTGRNKRDKRLANQIIGENSDDDDDEQEDDLHYDGSRGIMIETHLYRDAITAGGGIF